jgi:hypothetical protein
VVTGNAVSGARHMSLIALETTFASVAEDAPRLEAAALRLLDRATAMGDSYNVARAHMLLSQSGGLRFDVRALREHRQKAFDLFVEMGDLRAGSVSSINHASLELRIGRNDVVLRVLDEDTPVFERLGAPDILALRLASRAEALLLSEAHDEAMPVAREAYRLMLEVSEPRYVDETLTVAGAAEGCCGNYDAAIAALSEAIASSREHGIPQQTAYAIAWLIEICCRAGR